MHGIQLQTVIETEEFILRSKECMGEDVRYEFIDYIAENPTAGTLIAGAGGARKIRWQVNAYSGKRSGARVIYYYYNENIPIYLLTAYKKNEKLNLTEKEKKVLYGIIKSIVHAYLGE